MAPITLNSWETQERSQKTRKPFRSCLTISLVYIFHVVQKKKRYLKQAAVFLANEMLMFKCSTAQAKIT